MAEARGCDLACQFETVLINVVRFKKAILLMGVVFIYPGLNININPQKHELIKKKVTRYYVIIISVPVCIFNSVVDFCKEFVHRMSRSVD